VPTGFVRGSKQIELDEHVGFDEQVQQVTMGTWVKVTGFVPGQEEVFHLVPEGEADLLANKIPPGSPLARRLVGARVGDKVIFRPPAGRVELTILEAGRHKNVA
jgi:transcription elongation GreA/GreB family factor